MIDNLIVAYKPHPHNTNSKETEWFFDIIVINNTWHFSLISIDL